MCRGWNAAQSQKDGQQLVLTQQKIFRNNVGTADRTGFLLPSCAIYRAHPVRGGEGGVIACGIVDVVTRCTSLFVRARVQPWREPSRDALGTTRIICVGAGGRARQASYREELGFVRPSSCSDVEILCFRTCCVECCVPSSYQGSEYRPVDRRVASRKSRCLRACVAEKVQRAGVGPPSLMSFSRRLCSRGECSLSLAQESCLVFFP